MKLKYVVEIDGWSHDNRQQQDAARDSYLNGLGYTVSRFSNEDVLKDPDGIVAIIVRDIKDKHSPQ
jgi:very-short-patch-repair endonuclease